MVRSVRSAWAEIISDRTIATGPRDRHGFLNIGLTLRTPAGTVSDEVGVSAGGDPAWAEIRIPTDAFETKIELRGKNTVLTIRPRP